MEVIVIKKPNYKLKAELLTERQDVYDTYREFTHLNYLVCYTDLDFDEEYLETITKRSHFFIDNEPDLWLEARRVHDSYRHRARRLASRIGDMLKGGTCYFLTLTFSDATLGSTTEKTRRVYVTRFLKSVSANYVANIDFGGENNREHYHAVVVADKVDKSLWSQYGFIDCKKVRSLNDNVKLGKYISKLTNHALKVLVRGQRAIYSSSNLDKAN